MAVMAKAESKPAAKSAQPRGAVNARSGAIIGAIAHGVSAGAYRTIQAVCWTAPLVPAVLINLAAVHTQGQLMAAVAVGFVVSGAVAVESAVDNHDLSKRVLAALLAVFFVSSNIHTALTNVATGSEASRAEKTRLMRDHRRDENQSRTIAQSRQAQFELAGSATPESIEAEIQSAKAADATRWSATGGCDVARITAEPSKLFCSHLAQLAVKEAAAVRRDELDKQLAQLQAKDNGAVPKSVDPGAENLAKMLETAGLTVGEQGRAFLSLLGDWKWAIGAELIAAFLPMLLLAKLRGLATRTEGVPAPQRKTGPAIKEKIEPVASEARSKVSLEGDAEIDAFIARRLEFVAGESIAAGQLLQAWRDDCEEHGREPGSAKAFSTRIRNRVEYVRNGGHPVYRGVRLSVHRPRLAVVR